MLDVVAAVIRRDQLFLIARRKPGKSLEGKWEFPGGKIEPGEDGSTALAREILEEFGVAIEVLEHLVTVEHSYPSIDVRLHAYLGYCPNAPTTSTDHDALEWVPLDRLTDFDLAEADIPIVEHLKTQEAKRRDPRRVV